MSNLPRRLADDRHLQYEELLRQHFERQLSAEITPQMQMQGWTVISKEDVLVVGGVKLIVFIREKPVQKHGMAIPRDIHMLGIPWDLG